MIRRRSSGPGVEHGVELALRHDDVLLAAHAAVGQQLLHVEQPAGHAVDGVLALARAAEQRAGDGDLGEPDGEDVPDELSMVRTDLGPAQRRPLGRPGEDDVFHLRGPHRARALGAQHPRHGVDDVGLAAAVGADHDRDPRLELERGRVGERLEAFEGERLQEHSERSG